MNAAHAYQHNQRFYAAKRWGQEGDERASYFVQLWRAAHLHEHVLYGYVEMQWYLASFGIFSRRSGGLVAQATLQKWAREKRMPVVRAAPGAKTWTTTALLSAWLVGHLPHYNWLHALQQRRGLTASRRYRDLLEASWAAREAVPDPALALP